MAEDSLIREGGGTQKKLIEAQPRRGTFALTTTMAASVPLTPAECVLSSFRSISFPHVSLVLRLPPEQRTTSPVFTTPHMTRRRVSASSPSSIGPPLL